MSFDFDIICVLKSPTGGWPRFVEMHIRNEHRFYSLLVTYILYKAIISNVHQEMNGEKYEEYYINRLLLNLPHNLATVSLSFHHNRKR